ncbi:predicted protein [Chaetomium globosum CBS 148.51]|uniref:Uncharacterized protein n=1 Tax=Chaetomium globosum (strain ATCC 6205 / CBS 148.51 / DSM 1962 / NBRC 6347 / NRRL 1970) TaxID=306901 RepID=Q2GVI8_CHAGB|nr:uncharacterized protein CHGG_08016 [Chaetomium globosum CBS 148.51]EAQ86763.1 predicted protein [Chaetomium globosum CBS 148.51]
MDQDLLTLQRHAVYCPERRELSLTFGDGVQRGGFNIFAFVLAIENFVKISAD